MRRYAVAGTLQSPGKVPTWVTTTGSRSAGRIGRKAVPTGSLAPQAGPVPHLALGALLGLGGFACLLLILFAGGYGYHRDELYFLACAKHLAWGYPDQGPLTPFVAYVTSAVDPGSLTVLRLLSALMAGGTVLTTGLIARELGGGRRAQLLAGGCAAVASVILVTGHLLSTTTFDLLAWAVVTWLVARVLRTGAEWLWPLLGAVAGVALLNKPLIALLLAALGLGLLVVGPRGAIRRWGPWAGLAIALGIWSPFLIWQAKHGWPQFQVASSIAHGGSVSSQSRLAFLLDQLLLVSPVLAPVWIAGLVSMARRPSLAAFRLFPFAWALQAVFFLVTGGKDYYLSGLFPILLGAGAIELDMWLDRGSTRVRRRATAVALVGSALVSAVIALPVLPVAWAAPVVALNPDVGETIGWPKFVVTVADVYDDSKTTAVIFASNYGEAGAIDRFGPSLGLPQAYSGHNAFAAWGPPPDDPGPVVVVGLKTSLLDASFAGCRLEARVNDSVGVHNQELGVPIYLCSGTRRPWSQMWGSLRHVN